MDDSFKSLKPIDHSRTTDDIPSQVIRSFQTQILQRAQRALHKQSVSEREIATMVFGIRKQDLPEAKSMIKDFRRKFCRALEDECPEEVYCLNLAFFRLTEEKINDELTLGREKE